MGWSDTMFQRDSKIRVVLKIKSDDIFGDKAQFILKPHTRWLKPTAKKNSASNK